MQAADRTSRVGGRRIGLIIPSVNTTIEPEFGWLAPPGLSFHAARIMLQDTTPEGLRAMNAEVAGAARLIESINPAVVAYACTAGTFLEGPEALERQIGLIQGIVGCPVVATSLAMIAAARFLGARRIALATPYLQILNEAEQRFFEANGIEVVAARGLGLSGRAIREVPPGDVMTLAQAADVPEAEALFISCTDFRALEVVEQLEAMLQKPVLTSNQVTLWSVLRVLGWPEPLHGLGKLLR